MDFQIRRVRADEWREVRDQRLEALQDPLAHLAFLETYGERAVSPDEFWQERAAGAAEGTRIAQWVAEAGNRWIGTVAVFAYRAGDTDYNGESVTDSRANLVGVYVQPAHRGSGVIDALIDTAAEWAARQGFSSLELEVHPDNTAALRAYLRCGFVATGTGTEGDDRGDLTMRRALA